MTQGPRCDIVITKNHEVYINGTQIGWVKDFHHTVEYPNGDEVELRLKPTSVIFGEAPISTVSALHEAVVHNDSDSLGNGGTTVDIGRAIENAKKRVAGLPVGTPPGLKRKLLAKKAWDEPQPVEQEEP